MPDPGIHPRTDPHVHHWDDRTKQWKTVRGITGPTWDTLTPKEQDRLDALARPWYRRPFAYIDWLTSAMPDPAGGILFGSVVLLGVFVCSGSIVGLVLLALSPAAWIFWFLLGAVVGKFALWLLRSAAATELQYRRSTEDKIQAYQQHQQRRD